MEKKMSRRIVGILVIVALTIILLPLLNTKDAPLTQTAEVSPAPTFPEVVTADNNTYDDTRSDVTASHSGALVKKVLQTGRSVEIVDDSTPAIQTAAQAPASKSQAGVFNQPIAYEVASLVRDRSLQQVVKTNARIAAATAHGVKKGAWVVQLGSFKKKINAERLTNNLRAKGYRAFVFETKRNQQTRVYVGPEFKRVAAASLKSKLQNEFKIQGVVLTFKPLEI
jgi:DedD protein